jgi:hypothetical protein
VGRGIERNECATGIGEHVDQRRPQRVVVLVAVHEEHGSTLAEPPRRDATVLAVHIGTVELREPFRDARLTEASRHGVRTQEVVDGFIEASIAHRRTLSE